MHNCFNNKCPAGYLHEETWLWYIFFWKESEKKPSKSRVASNCECSSMLWKIKFYFNLKKAQSCLKCLFRNWFIFLDSFCPTWPINRCRGASHSPHSKQHFPALLLDEALACGSYRQLECFAHNSLPFSVITPTLKSWDTDPAKLLTVYNMERKLLGIHRLLILMRTLLVAKIFLCSVCQWKWSKNFSW